MSERFSIERCRENFRLAVNRALAIDFRTIDNNDQEYPVEMGRISALYREQYNHANG